MSKGGVGGIRDLYACTFIGLYRLYHCVKGGGGGIRATYVPSWAFKIVLYGIGKEEGWWGGGWGVGSETCMPVPS